MKDVLGWEWIENPTLLINSAIARANIQRMASKARRLGLQFRPHFKTIQSAALAQWFKDAGVEKITVSSLEMAAYFAGAGWRDITVAFPINVRAIDTINKLASIVRLGVLISDASVLPVFGEKLQQPVQAWVELDTGDGRSGFAWDDSEGIAAVVAAIQKIPRLQFAGLLGHGGFTYRSHGKAEIQKAHDSDIWKLGSARTNLERTGIQGFMVSTGDTPGCSIAENFEGADEIRPGNFVFYDVQQQQVGSCGFENIAVALACPVVAVYRERNEIVVHGGGVHLGKDGLATAVYGNIYGRIAMPKPGGWEMPEMGCFLRGISQEHGVAVLRPDLIAAINVGDLVCVLPVHSCMCADLMMQYHRIDGPDREQPLPMMKAGLGIS